MSVTCRVGFRRYEFQSEQDLNRARDLYEEAMTRTDAELDDYEVQENFEGYLEKAGIEFHYDV